MKRVFACVLALLLLPIWALAGEPTALRVTLETDAQRLSAMMPEASEDARKVTAEFISTLTATLSLGEEEVSICVNAGKDTLFDACVIQKEDSMSVVSSLMPGYVVLLDAADNTGNRSLKDAILHDDYSVLGTSLKTMLDQYMTSVDVTGEDGNFMGDAYEFGSFRERFRLDERDLALLVDLTLDTMAKNGDVQRLCNLLGTNPQRLFADLRTKAHSAALENDYEYNVSVVYDGTGEVMGLSVTAFQADVQIATLSLGFYSDGIEAVWGYGSGGSNYYMNFSVLHAQTDGGEPDHTYSLSTYLDRYGEGYRTVSLREDTLLQEYVLYLVEAEEELLEGSFTFRDETGKDVVSAGFAFATGEELYGQVDVYLDSAAAPQVTARVETVPYEQPVAVDTEGLFPLDLNEVSEAEKELLSEAVVSGLSDAGIRLFRLLPPELLVTLLFQ